MNEALKMFPIQDGPDVPWEAAEQAYETYGRGGQTLERLAERGGFGMDEFVMLFHGLSPSRSIDSYRLGELRKQAYAPLMNERDKLRERVEQRIKTLEKEKEESRDAQFSNVDFLCGQISELKDTILPML